LADLGVGDPVFADAAILIVPIHGLAVDVFSRSASGNVRIAGGNRRP
jgi:hypothetical protein